MVARTRNKVTSIPIRPHTSVRLGSIKKLIPPMNTNTAHSTWYFSMNPIGFLENSNLMPKTVGMLVGSVGVPLLWLYPVGLILILFTVLF